MKNSKYKRIIKDQYIEPKRFTRSGFSYLTLKNRKKIEEMLKDGKKIKDIALELNISRSTIFYERERCGGVSQPYNAEEAHKDAQKSRLANTHRHNVIPKAHAKFISHLYRIIKDLRHNKTSINLNEKLEDCMFILEQMGANPEKIKNPVTLLEEEKIEKLYNEGVPLNEISRKMRRSRSTVWKVIERIKYQKPKEDTYAILKDKWLD